MKTSVPSLQQQKVPSLVFGAHSSSNSLVSILSFESRKDVAPRVPKRKSSSDLFVGYRSTSDQQCENSSSNARFEDGCNSESLVGSTTTMASLIDGLGCLSPVAKKKSSMKSITSYRLMDDLTTKSDTPPAIPQRELSTENRWAIREFYFECATE
ncbi:unnamed protein product [Cylindrotheca closterium]|uniref:Uncharacterized protein n=1 Tax=Cylindrotheca closterium TaxID=2856 RepID=A0AAD2FY25_9STRA|nr:unnamed protein product [Cylindrotheca closterium]